MTELTPAEVALGDQWHAEMMEDARTITNRLLATHDLTLDADENRLMEMGYDIGSSATLLLLMRKGWIRKPEGDR